MENIPHLYHYTSPDGLLGIALSGSLWFTNVDYLNDLKESTYGIHKIAEVLKANYNSPTLASDLMVLDAPSPSSRGIFTFSFTEESDLLSQWRGYCPDGGFCISINHMYLKKMQEKFGIVFKKCIYSDSDIEALVRTEIVGLTNQEFKTHYDQMGLSSSQDIRRKIFEKTAFYSPFIKHMKFAEEKEWRMILRRDINITPNNEIVLRFRATKNLIIPYIALPLVPERGGSIFSRIIVGPSANMKLAGDACRALVMDPEKVSNSEIPYRNW
jgi:hypothetical protein